MIYSCLASCLASFLMQYISIPVGSLLTCNGHGRCMSMAELALWAENNGDATDFTYGNDPNNPLTWDANRIHGCLCDEGFSGFDCSLVDCPRGDDPGTYDDHVEVGRLALYCMLHNNVLQKLMFTF